MYQLTEATLLVALLICVFDQHQTAWHRMIAHIVVLTERLRFRCGKWIEVLAANPSINICRTDHVAVTNTTDPIPAHAVDQSEPRATKTGIGNQNGYTACRQHGGELRKKRLMHAR